MSGNVGYFDDGTTYDPDYVAWWWSRQRPRGTEDYRLHAYLQRSPGSGLSGGGAHDMSKPLGSQPPPPGTTLYVQQPQGGAPPPGQQGPPPQQCAPPQGQQGPPQGPQHLASTLQQGMAFYSSRQAQQVQQGPPQQPNPQAAPQQVQGQCPPQQVGGNQGRGGGGLGRPPPMGLSGAPGQGGPPPPGSVGQAPTNYQTSIINFASSQSPFQTQHITPMGILNCMNIPAFPTQRTSQFNTAAAQYVYPHPQYLPPQHIPQQHQAAVYFTSPGIGPMPMGVAPPQAQAPRGQHTSPQGSQPLQPRQKRVLAICDPNTGRSIFDDAETPPAESSPAATPEQQQSSSSTSDIPGTFAAQVAATLVDAPAPSKSPVAPAPPPPAAVVLEPPQTKSNERVAEWVAAAAAAATTTAPSPTERQGSPPAEEEKVVAPSPPDETAAVLATEEKEGEEEVAPVEVGEVRNSEGRTPVVVEEGARRPGDWEPERTAATAAALEASREAADGRESKKSLKKKKMKEWNKKGENKEGGDMDAFVDREEPAAPASPASAASTPTEPTEAVPSAPLRTPSPTPLAAPQRASPSPQPAPEVAPAPTPVPVAPPVVVTPEQADPAAGEDEVHRKLVIIQNEENLRVSQEMAATEIVEKAEEPAPVSPSPQKEEEEEDEEEGVEEEEDEEGESGDGGTPAQRLKYNYKEDQWSPLNPEGRKQYDRSFLIMLQGEPMSLKKPFGLPNLDVIKDTAMQHKLPEVQRPQYPPGGPPQMGGGGPMGGRGAHPEHLFMPPYARNGVARPPPGGGGGVGRRQSQPGRGGDKPKKVITLSSSLNQDVKLHAAQNAWKPTHKTPVEAAAEVAEAEELYRRVRGILNKLTPQKFQSLVEQVKNLQINSEERLNRVIDLVFEKALDEPNFSVPYANMCKQLAMFEVPMSSNEAEKVNFRKLLLLKCQKEFEKDKGEDIRKAEQRKKIEEATTEEEKAKLREEMADEEKRSKRRSLGNIRFIGELYNLNMLTAPIMYDCLRRLLNSNDEDSLECLCKLLITIGKELDAISTTKGSQPGGKGGPPRSQLDDYFRTMDSIVKKREVSLRVVFMLQDVIDLRMRKWIPRRDENIPKTIDQIHEEAQREQVQEKLMRDVPLPKRDDRQDRRGGGKNRGGGGYDDGWNTVPSKKQHQDYNKSMDFNKVKQISTKMTEQDSIQLGPSARMSSWAKGSSGGGKMASQEPEGRSSGATNRFSALADVGSYDSRRGAQRSTASSRESSRGRGGSQQQQQQGGSQSSLGVRKTPSQSRERDAALAAVKNLAAANAGPSPGPPSSSAQQHAPAPSPPEAASQEAAAPLAAPAGQGESRPREPDLVLRGLPGMDEDILKTRTEALVDQFLCNSDFQDAVQNVVELASPSNVDAVVSTSINHILDRSPEARTLVGQLLKELLKKKLLSLDLFTKGLHSVLEYGEDMELDIPKVWEYVAELMAPLFQDHWLTLQYLRDAAQPLRAQGRAGRLAACVLALLAKTLGEAAVAQLWRTAGLQWKDFLKPGEDVEAFAAANGVLFTLGGGGGGPATAAVPGATSPAPGGASAGGPAESVSSLTAAEVQAQLKYLVVSKGAPSAAIIEWIESNLGEAYARQPHFIRALITVIAENAITTLADGNAELKDELVKGYMDLLQKYLDHREELELQALYALQALVNRLQHPKGILVHLFNAFYDCDLISEDAFQQWAESPDPAEQEGKGVALKSTTSFFAWLGEMEGDSGEDN